MMSVESETVDTFIHKFGGWLEGRARRWRNPNGSDGGIVAVSASVHESTILFDTVEVWPGAEIAEGVSSIGHSVSIGEGVRISKGVCICEGVRISKGVNVGAGSTIGDATSVDVGTCIDRHVIIGCNVIIGSNVMICYGASIGVSASIGNRASIGDGASIQADDWFFVIGPQGSRNTWATAVWSSDHGLRWWIGCQQGISTEEFRKRVEHDHGSAAHGDDYRHVIVMVETHPGLARAIAAHAKTLTRETGTLATGESE